MAEMTRRRWLTSAAFVASGVVTVAIGRAMERDKRSDLLLQKQEQLRGAALVLNNKTSGGWVVNEHGSVIRMVKDPDGKNTYAEVLKLSERTGLVEYWQLNNRMVQENVFILRNGDVTRDEVLGPGRGDETIGTMRQIPLLTGKLDHRAYIKELGRTLYEATEVAPPASRPGFFGRLGL